MGVQSEKKVVLKRLGERKRWKVRNFAELRERLDLVTMPVQTLQGCVQVLAESKQVSFHRNPQSVRPISIYVPGL